MSPVSEQVDWRVDQRERAKELRHLLVDAELTQTDVGAAMGVPRSRMSDYLNVHRQWPEDFEARFRAVVRALQGGAR